MTTTTTTTTPAETTPATTPRVPVWGRLGGGMQTALPQGTTVQDALHLQGLTGWDVEKMPLVTMGHDGEPLATEKVATVRRTPDGGSAVLGVGLSNGYAVVQNETALAMDTLVDQGDAAVDFAGAWAGGKRVFLSMRLPEHVLVGGEDRTDLYLTAMSSHDGSLALTVLVTPVRFICTNVLPVLLKQTSNVYRVRHTGDAGLKVQEAREALDLTFAYAKAWEAEMEALLAKSCTEAQFAKIVEREFLPLDPEAGRITENRVKDQRDQVMSLYTTSPTTEFGRGTRYGAFNALTEWSEWIAPKDPTREAAATSTLEGAGATFRQRAYRVLASK